MKGAPLQSREEQEAGQMAYEERMTKVAEFRSKVVALLNSSWPRRAQDTVDGVHALAGQLRNWETRR